MGSPFTISVLSKSIRLGEDLSGRADFTVKNDSGVGRHVRADVKTDRVGEGAPRFSVVEPAELSLDVEQSDRFVVSIDGSGTPAGKYVFRLLVVAEDDPDEVFSESGNVEVEVPETEEPEEPDRRPFPWWIAVAAAVLLIVGTVAFLLLRDGEQDFEPPELVSPENAEIVRMLILSPGVFVSWEGVPGAESYTVAYQICSPCGPTVESFEPSSPFMIPVGVDKTVNWSVTAHMGEIEARSETWTFTTQLRPLPTFPFQTIPFETIPFGEGD